MKRIASIIIVLIATGVFLISCNNYVCPAYASDVQVVEQTDEVDS